MQIIRIDGNQKFIEVLDDFFSAERIILNFCQYDKSKGNKMTLSIPIYISFDEFLALAQDVKTGRLMKLEEHKYNGLFHILGGTSAAVLKKRNKSRADGMSESRKFFIKKGDKLPILLNAQRGPGTEDDKGLIRPSKLDEKIMIPMSSDDFKKIILRTEMEILSYLTAKRSEVNNINLRLKEGSISTTGKKLEKLKKEGEETLMSFETFLNGKTEEVLISNKRLLVTIDGNFTAIPLSSISSVSTTVRFDKSIIVKVSTSLGLMLNVEMKNETSNKKVAMDIFNLCSAS